MSLRTPRLLPVLLLLAAATLGGCGEEDGAGEAPAPGREETSEAPATPDPGSEDRTPPSEALQRIRVVGEVVRVDREHGCVVVRDQNAITWTLVGDPVGGLEVGDRVSAVGAPDLAATGCDGSVVRTSRVDVQDG